MSEPACECGGPGDCPRYGRAMSARSHQLCRGEGVTPARSEAHRRALRIAAGGPEPERPRPTGTPVRPLRPPCVHQGVLLEECKGCGGIARSVYACDHPDDGTGEYDRCTRGRNNGADPLIRSCLDCPGYSAKVNVTGVPPTSRVMDTPAAG